MNAIVCEHDKAPARRQTNFINYAGNGECSGRWCKRLHSIIGRLMSALWARTASSLMEDVKCCGRVQNSKRRAANPRWRLSIILRKLLSAIRLSRRLSRSCLNYRIIKDSGESNLFYASASNWRFATRIRELKVWSPSWNKGIVIQEDGNKYDGCATKTNINGILRFIVSFLECGAIYRYLI